MEMRLGCTLPAPRSGRLSPAQEVLVPKLIVRDTERTAVVDIQGGERVVIGRSHDCDIPVAAPRASRRHAEIGPPVDGDVRGGHIVSDLDSTNGTLLNGAPFPEPTLLQDRDVVDVGGCQVTYRSAH